MKISSTILFLITPHKLKRSRNFQGFALIQEVLLFLL